MKDGTTFQTVALLLGFAVFALCVSRAWPAFAQTDLNQTMEQFDDVRALAMRGMKQAQDLKTVALYGRGFGLDMPESGPEDMLIEGLWLFDYLDAMDVTSMSLISYAAANEHPHLEQELQTFGAFLPEAARRTLAYYDKTAKALADAKVRVNKAGAAFEIEILPRQPVIDGANEKIAGDGFRLGWYWDVQPSAGSDMGRFYKQHGYTPARLFKMAEKFDLDYIRPQNSGLFGWQTGKSQEDEFNFSRVDAALALYRKHSLSIWLPVPNAPGYAGHVKAVIKHIRETGVPIIAVEIDDKRGRLPAARKEAWLKEHGRAPAEPKTKAQRRLAVCDDIRWREQEYVEYLRPMVEAIRAVAPDVPIVVKTPPPVEGSIVQKGRSDELIARELGTVPYGRSEENIWDDLRRAYSDTHFAAAETHSGSGNAFAQYAFSGYIHGALAIHSGVTPMLRGFYWPDSFLYPDFRPRWSTLFDWRRFHERAQSMAPEMRNTIPTPQTVMLWSHTSDLYQSFTTDWGGGSYGFRMGPANYHRIGSFGWGRLLDMINLTHDFVTEQQALEGALDRYELLVLPAAQALPAGVVEAIRKYVRAGGNVIATSAPGLADENMEEKGPGQLADVFGADFDKFIGAATIAGSALQSPTENEALFRHWSGQDVFDKPAVEAMRTVYCTFKPHKGTTVLAKFTDGKPAITLNKFGKGQAVVIGYPVGREFFMSDTYHMHYGHNWADWPSGSLFQQGVCLYIENILDKMKIKPVAVVSHEYVPRPIGQDAGWPAWKWPRKGGGYRDFVWKKSSLPGTTAPHRRGYAEPRSVELALRARDGNPNLYLTIFNREGAYGFDPGVVHFAATSKLLKIEIRRDDISHVYDLSLGCLVPTKLEAGSTTLNTMIEPSMARMLVMSTGQDDKIRLYEGRRTRGDGDSDLRESVAQTGRIEARPLQNTIIGEKDIVQFLTDRAAEGITISCESPMWLASAKNLAKALEDKFGRPVRISRNSPRIEGSHNALGTWRSEGYSLLESPDVILGNRTGEPLCGGALQLRQA